MKRIVIRSLDDLRFVRCDGPETFAIEAEHDDAPEMYRSLFGFVCDEQDGPVVHFGFNMQNVDIDLAALRELLDNAEKRLLRARREGMETVA